MRKKERGAFSSFGLSFSQDLSRYFCWYNISHNNFGLVRVVKEFDLKSNGVSRAGSNPVDTVSMLICIILYVCTVPCTHAVHLYESQVIIYGHDKRELGRSWANHKISF